MRLTCLYLTCTPFSDVRLYVALESAPATPLGLRAYVHPEAPGYVRTCARAFTTHAVHREVRPACAQCTLITSAIVIR